MNIGITYFLIIIFANTLGAISGMGGGILIKPLFDFVGHDSVAAISFYSAIAVFTMAVVSTFKQIKDGTQLNWNFANWIAGGAAVGGMFGNSLLNFLLQLFPNERHVTMIQIVLTILSIFFSLGVTTRKKANFRLAGNYWYCFSGLILGICASFLGIGGGPINVALLILLFNIPLKEATVYSICIILFSQGFKLINITITGDFSSINFYQLIFIIPAAILGGYIGALFSKFMLTKYVAILFQIMLLIVVIINVYNYLQLLD